MANPFEAPPEPREPAQADPTRAQRRRWIGAASAVALSASAGCGLAWDVNDTFQYFDAAANSAPTVGLMLVRAVAPRLALVAVSSSTAILTLSSPDPGLEAERLSPREAATSVLLLAILAVACGILGSCTAHLALGNPQGLAAHLRHVDVADALTFIGHTSARAGCLAMLWPAVTRWMPYGRWGSGAPALAALVACEVASTPFDVGLFVILDSVASTSAGLSSP